MLCQTKTKHFYAISLVILLLKFYYHEIHCKAYKPSFANTWYVIVLLYVPSVCTRYLWPYHDTIILCLRIINNSIQIN